MEQLDIENWIDQNRVIKSMPPAQAIQHRTFVIEQLKPIMQELDYMELSPLAISEAMAHYMEKYRQAALERLCKK